MNDVIGTVDGWRQVASGVDKAGKGATGSSQDKEVGNKFAQWPETSQEWKLGRKLT